MVVAQEDATTKKAASLKAKTLVSSSSTQRTVLSSSKSNMAVPGSMDKSAVSTPDLLTNKEQYDHPIEVVEHVHPW